MLPKNIRALRTSLGYTQSQVADYLELTPAAVTQYETGTRPIPSDVVSKLAVLFGVDEYELYQENPQQNNILSAFAFRANQLENKDLQSIAAFKKIVLNYFHLKNTLENEQ
jgi:transcriptional regulator with XRE-family HTH domain